MRPVIVAADIITPYGKGLDVCWQGLTDGRTAISRVARFRTAAFQSEYAGIIPGLEYHGRQSLVMQMFGMLFSKSAFQAPSEAHLLLATTKGEIDLLEMNILAGRGNAEECSLDRLLERVENLSGARGGSMIISAACTSSSAAAGRAAAMIRSGSTECVLVAACDSVTEFIFSGFSTLMAMDKTPARPFDRNRAGLSVGEAAAFALIMSEKRARRENRQILGSIAGWGLSDDANHMTGPSRESEGLIIAITKALRSAGIGPEEIGFISAHGTGTVYNDAMEMRAFRAVFRDRQVPVYSIKGGIGHTMGAAGLVETIVALRSLQEKKVPGTVNLQEADDDSAGWVSAAPRPLESGRYALLTNAGFSGINSALILTGVTI